MISLFTNPSEMTSANALNRANKVLQSAMERLATGKRINSAADDAAGLQIATRLQGQSNGMTVAQQNISKASSMLQTAEGAFDEVTNILYRMKDLATQGADDTSSASDRNALQSEFSSLNDELTNILKNTTYGSERLFSSAVSVKHPENAVEPEPTEISKNVPPPGQPMIYNLEDIERVPSAFYEGKFSAYKLRLSSEDGAIINKLFDMDDPDYSRVNSFYVLKSYEWKLGVPGIEAPQITLDYTRPGSVSAESGSPVLLKSSSTSASAGLPGENASDTSSILWDNGGASTRTDSPTKSEPAPATVPESDSPSVTIETPGKLTKALQFQIGAGKDEVMKLDLSEQINDVALAIGDLSGAGHDLSTGASANSMIGRISDVLNSVGAVRSSLGASINRLGHTSNNLANMKDNTDNSIGVIRDTDYASESSQMTRQQMLAQSSQLMLRQAGSMSNMILNFLK